jgi:hypothetical protein
MHWYPMLTFPWFLHQVLSVPKYPRSNLGCIGSRYQLCHCFNICIRCPLYQNISGPILEASVADTNFAIALTSVSCALVPEYPRPSLGSIGSRCQLTHCFSIHINISLILEALVDNGNLHIESASVRISEA